MTPSAPAAIIGNVNMSSPEITEKSFGLYLIIFMHCSRFPDASFIAMIFLKSFASFNVVSADKLEAVLPGTLYKMIGRGLTSEMAL